MYNARGRRRFKQCPVICDSDSDSSIDSCSSSIAEDTKYIEYGVRDDGQKA